MENTDKERASKVYGIDDVAEDEIYYRNSKDVFVKFLTTESIFKGIFYNNNQANCPYNAEKFYIFKNFKPRIKIFL